ncbi:MAG: hypothetical protein H8E51_01570 [Bacteroidetes bacterium]|nr:hypothetical protein [Bacteroidota bacterium]
MKQKSFIYTCFFLSLFFLGSSGLIVAQHESELWIAPSNPDFRAKYADVEFGEAIAVKVIESQTKNYFIVDLTKFNSRFEKIWYINLVFKEEKIVNIDPDIANDRLWFQASRQYDESDVLELFASLKEKTDQVSLKMTLQEKKEWMVKNDKYQQRNMR